MKKFIISLFIILSLLGTPTIIKAQVNIQEEIRQQLILLLTQLIQQLQQQIADILAQQTINITPQDNITGVGTKVEIVKSCELFAENYPDSNGNSHITIRWTTQNIPEGTVGNLFVANRWVGDEPDFAYGNSTGSPILVTPSGSYSNGISRSGAYKAVFGDISCVTKLK